ncbi:MAG: hypothetical protein AAFR60_04405 [Pseudomonadota bacterium]
MRETANKWIRCKALDTDLKIQEIAEKRAELVHTVRNEAKSCLAQAECRN